MQRSDLSVIPKREAVAFLAVATITVALLQTLFYYVPTPSLDALRYIDYALNIHEHGVFGLSGRYRDIVPAPSNNNSPLYPAFLAFAMLIDPSLQETLRCVASRPDIAVNACSSSYRVLVLLQNTFVIGSLFLLWATARILFQRRSIAAIACILALASTKLLFFANHLLTEVLILFQFAALMFVLVVAYRSQKHRHFVIAGLIVGLMTLTRPEYLYLGYSFILVGAGIACALRSKRVTILTGCFGLSLLFVISPWIARNHHHFDRPVVTGGYSDVIISQRTAYNRMSFIEWSAAFIYWLPGYGESLAAKFLAPSSYAKLRPSPDSYVILDSKEIFSSGLAAVDGDRERLTGYLLKTEILNHPIKHVIAGIPLAWRGILTGKYLAIVGLPCALILLVNAIRHRRSELLILAAPALTMIILYSMISVSVPRYNVYLIYYYAIATAWVIISLADSRNQSPPQ
jgi:hypothetical protein